MTAEIADGWMPMHFIPADLEQYRPTLEEGFARRHDGMTFDKFAIQAHVSVRIETDVRSAIDAAKPAIALYVGGMGAREKNFHTDAMVSRGFAEAAERIQELYLAGRKDEAAAAVPDDYVATSSWSARLHVCWSAGNPGGIPA